MSGIVALKFNTLNMKILTIILILLSFYANAASDKLIIASPTDYQVVQRYNQWEGKLHVQGATSVSAKKWQYRLVGKSVIGNKSQGWHSFPSPDTNGKIDFAFNAPAGGWYKLELRGVTGLKTLAQASVLHVGIGEVFIIAGQSNAGNHGSEKQNTKTGNVSSFSGKEWQLAVDPQPGSDGVNGSFIPSFGDAMNERFHVPIGITAVAAGGTSVRQWLPKGALVSKQPTTGGMIATGSGEWESKGNLFDRITNRLHYFGPQGVRALLWHQGESDAGQARSGYPANSQISGDEYFKYMSQLIQAATDKAGYKMPWFTAQTTYHNEKDPSDDEFRSAMKKLWDKGLSLEGPDTDQLRAEYRDGVHFNGKGLQKHGQLWAEKVGAWLDKLILSENGNEATFTNSGNHAK